MSTETAIILCVLIFGALVIKWYGDWKQREATSEFFRKQVDRQIDERDGQIKKQTEQVKETADEYFKRMAKYRKTAKYHNNLLRGYDDPDDGGQSK